MSISADKVLTDDSSLSRTDKLFFRFESICNFLGGIAIFLIILLSTANVLGRWLFSLPIDGYIDWIEQSMAFIVFLGIAYTMRLGGHIRMEILIRKVHNRSLWLTEFLTTLVTLFLILILVYGSYLHFLRAYTIGDSSLDINLPTWPAKLIVPIALYGTSPKSLHDCIVLRTSCSSILILI